LRERHEQGASPRAMAAELAVGSAPQTLRDELARHGLPYDPAQARRRRKARQADEAARRHGFETFAAYLDTRLDEGISVSRMARQLGFSTNWVDARAAELGRTVPRARPA